MAIFSKKKKIIFHDILIIAEHSRMTLYDNCVDDDRNNSTQISPESQFILVNHAHNIRGMIAIHKRAFGEISQ